jgi:hypothetical protein
MSEKKKVGSMTDRQRRTLAAMLTAVPSGCEGAEAAEAAETAELENPPFGRISAHRTQRDEHRAMALSS